MQPNAQDVTLTQIQTALLGLSLNCALYAVVYTAAASACVDGGLLGGFVRRSTRSQEHRRGEARARMLSYGRCFAAGVFLANLFLGMMPAVRYAVQAVQEKHGTVHGAFPIAEALVFVGFLRHGVLRRPDHRNSPERSQYVPLSPRRRSPRKRSGWSLHRQAATPISSTRAITRGRDY
ncbi:hypothetical protein HPB51_008116 [Rhipicephalus microplus]|uniref:Uncharacterized protein n=1 Tax=Rhipicephalus microplus TaxID=6941 RepID=A0A9J6ENM5_RHIMP|nr:hypothetical protein HPB51_008116 [Rhipicephalus microplus]